MFWFVFFFFPGKPGSLLPRETPPSRAGVPAPGRAGCVQEAPPAPLRLGRPRWRFCPRRPLRKAGDRRPSDGGGGKEASRGSRSNCMGTSSRI